MYYTKILHCVVIEKRVWMTKLLTYMVKTKHLNSHVSSQFWHQFYYNKISFVLIWWICPLNQYVF